MVEPLVMQPRSGGYRVDGDLEKILPLVRQAVELGADIIKADPCDDLSQYHKVVEAAAWLAGARARRREASPTRKSFKRTARADAAGRSGIVYGRNVIQHEDPAGMTRALMAIVHEDGRRATTSAESTA